MSNHLKYLFLLLVFITSLGNGQVEGVSKESPYHNDWTDFNKNGKQDNYENPKLSTDERAKDLMSQMTLEEKAGQLLTPYGWPMYERKGNDVVITDELKKEVGLADAGTHIIGSDLFNNNLASVWSPLVSYCEDVLHLTPVKDVDWKPFLDNRTGH